MSILLPREKVIRPIPRPAMLTRMKNWMGSLVRQEAAVAQGRHVDPEAPGTPPPDTGQWTDAWRQASQSPEMRAFADGLRPPGGGPVRAGVLSDLAAYYHLTDAEVTDRCLGWEADSVREWQAGQRDSAAGLAEFYNSVESWSFDLLWYAYLQAAGYGYPASLIVAGRLGAPSRGGRLLDLGSGAGVTAQLFAALGWEVTLADVSATLLAFARWRHEQRGVQARYLHLPADLPDGAFDLITALDVLGHVPDVTETARRLHRALRPGGLLVGNFDVRPRSAANAWHLYQDDLPLRWAIQRAGFVPVRIIDGAMWVYRAEPAGGAAARLHAALAWARLASPPVRVSRKTMRLLARAALRARQADRGSEPLTGLK